jgi:hypothetical protein
VTFHAPEVLVSVPVEMVVVVVVADLDGNLVIGFAPGVYKLCFNFGLDQYIYYSTSIFDCCFYNKLIN